MGHALEDRECYWPNGRIPYRLASHLTGDEVDAIQNAIDFLNENTPLWFFPRGSHRDYVMFVHADSGCNSDLGKTGGRQRIKCNYVDTASTATTPAVFNTDSILHEVGHAVGLLHEHQRPDRNRFIRVRKEHIKDTEEAHGNYEIRDERKIGSYVRRSIMHYDGQGGRWRKKSTIPIIQNRVTGLLGNTTFSDGDIESLEQLYGRGRGSLVWYGHRGVSDGDDDWAFAYGRQVGSGWQRYRLVTVAQSGATAIYGVERRTGDLKWYRHDDPRNGRNRWAANSGVRVGTGWQGFRHVAAGSDGTIYAIDKSDTLRWYRHLDFRTGGNRWHSNSGALIGTGWQRFTQLAASGPTLYVAKTNGELHWYRHRRPQTGANVWALDSGRRIGTGWQVYRQLASSIQGRIYALV